MKESFQATFKERTRHLSFFVLCIGLIFSITLMIPQGSGVMRAIIINPDTYKQADNASWSSISISFIMGFFLPLIGAAFLRNSVQLDRDNGTMDLFLTTKFSRLKYMIGKFASNFCIMFIFWLLILFFSVIETLLKYQLTKFSLIQFFLPFFILLPGLIFVSAITLLTEVIPLLHGRIGTVVLITFLTILYASGTGYQTPNNHLQRIFNVSGSNYLITNIKQSIEQTSNKGLTLLRIIGSTSTNYTGKKELIFLPLKLTTADLFNMIILILLSFFFVFLASLFLEHNPIKKVKFNLTKSNTKKAKLSSENLAAIYTPLKLLIRSVPSYWILLMILIWIWNFITDYRSFIHLTFPLMFLTAIPLYAELGSAEVKNNVYQWLGTISNAQKKHTFKESVTGVLLSLLLILPSVNKVSIMVLITLIFWAIQLPLLAQTLGHYAKSKQPFQVILIVFFYLYLNGAPLLPFDQANLVMLALVYLIIATICLIALRSNLSHKTMS